MNKKIANVNSVAVMLVCVGMVLVMFFAKLKMPLSTATITAIIFMALQTMYSYSISSVFKLQDRVLYTGKNTIDKQIRCRIILRKRVYLCDTMTTSLLMIRCISCVTILVGILGNRPIKCIAVLTQCCMVCAYSFILRNLYYEMYSLVERRM